jgi:hypothetical protein
VGLSLHIIFSPDHQQRAVFGWEAWFTVNMAEEEDAPCEVRILLHFPDPY